MFRYELFLKGGGGRYSVYKHLKFNLSQNFETKMITSRNFEFLYIRCEGQEQWSSDFLGNTFTFSRELVVLEDRKVEAWISLNYGLFVPLSWKKWFFLFLK